MRDDSSHFYNALAENYHLIFEDWNASVERQANMLGALVECELSASKISILDCACGVGTQALGLATRGHAVLGTDISSSAIARARREALQRGLSISFEIADIRDLSTVPQTGFDAVLAMDNALPHLLSDGDLQRAVGEIAAKLRHGGVFVASIRDYDALLQHHPTGEGPFFYSDDGSRRIVQQVWDWIDDRKYVLHLYITRELNGEWECDHYASNYRAVTREDVTTLLVREGLADVRWLMPSQTCFYQPIVVCRYP